MSQNLCLICCYSFQEKRTRIISDEAQEAFRKFCGELRVPLSKKEIENTCGFDLPYGERITVCGDCLSLVVAYANGRTVQCHKEEKLLELQKMVCALLKDLEEVVKEVQGHIENLHCTVRTGDESNLDSFCEKGKDPREFRARILKLNTGFIKNKTAERNDVQVQAINIKSENLEREDEARHEVFNDDEGEDHFNDSLGVADDDQGFEVTDFPTPKIVGAIGNDEKGPITRRRRHVIAQEKKLPKSIELHSTSNEEYSEDLADFDDGALDGESWPSNCSDEKDRIEKTGKRNRGPYRKKLKPAKKMKPKRVSNNSFDPSKATNLQALLLERTQWKDDLISRIVMQMNNDIHDNNDGDGDSTKVTVSNSFEFVDGKLILRGIPVKILENQRGLKCTKCGQRYFQNQNKDSSNDDNDNTQLETLMKVTKDHILSIHIYNGVDEADAVEGAQCPGAPIDVEMFTTYSKTKKTIRITCPLKYTYRECKTREVSGSAYYQCDYRVQKNYCSALICRRNDGLYYRCRKGWNSDGSHTLHAPDVESADRQIELAKAIAMHIEDPSKSAKDIYEEMLKQSNGQLLNSEERLKVRMRYAKRKQKLGPMPWIQCPHCDSSYQRVRFLNEHIVQCHESSVVGQNVKKKRQRNSATSPKKATEPKPEIKPNMETSQAQPHGPGPSEAPTPAIVFNDPSVASNFVNKCVTAIMQQVGLAIPGNDSTQVRPISCLPPGNNTSTSASPTTVSSQQHHSGTMAAHNHVPPPNSGLWHIHSHSSAPPGFTPIQSSSSHSNQQLPGWPS